MGSRPPACAVNPRENCRRVPGNRRVRFRLFRNLFPRMRHQPERTRWGREERTAAAVEQEKEADDENDQKTLAIVVGSSFISPSSSSSSFRLAFRRQVAHSLARSLAAEAFPPGVKTEFAASSPPRQDRSRPARRGNRFPGV